jgi:hypothetical protein
MVVPSSEEVAYVRVDVIGDVMQQKARLIITNRRDSQITIETLSILVDVLWGHPDGNTRFIEESFECWAKLVDEFINPFLNDVSS